MNDNEAFIPVFAIFCTIGLPIMAWMMFRLLKHRERMEMIRHGMAPTERVGTAWVPPPQQPQVSERRGKRKGRGGHDEEIDPPHVTLRKGIRLSMIGLAITIGLSFIGFDGHPEPGPWLLGGLIPMFVGLSQVILALLSGASLQDTAQPWPANTPPPYGGAPPPPPGPPGASGAPVYDNSYTYRPGNQQELQPPAGPPDRR
jgi:hypothetical protein